MTIKYVIDASAALKWFFPEDYSAEALALLSEDNIQFVAPDLIINEMVNSIWKRVKKKEMTEESALSTIERLHQEFIKPQIIVLMSSGQLMDAAFKAADLLQHPATYDCFYLALAESQQLPCVTADQPLYNKTRNTMFAALVTNLSSLVTIH